MSYHLTNEHIITLTELLIACPSLNDKSIRNDVVQFLPQDVQGAIDRRDQGRADVINIVRTCITRDKIECFIAAVRCYEGASSPMQELDQAFDAIIKETWQFDGISSIPTPDITDLFRMLVPLSLSDAPLRQCYQQSSPPGPEWTYPQGYGEAETLAHIIQQLAEAPLQHQSKTHPLVDFVSCLAKRGHTLTPKQRQSLIAWTEQVAAALGISTKSSRSLTKQVYLLVQISPIPPTSSKEPTFSVAAWLMNEQNTVVKTIKPIDEQSYTLDVLPEIFQTVIKDGKTFLAGLQDELADLSIEFLLPLELLLHNVEHWKAFYGLRTVERIGIQHRVVVRSLDRVLFKITHPQWKAKWQWFQHLHSISMEKLIWIHTREAYDSNTIFAELINQSLNRIGFALTCSLIEDTETMTDMLVKIIDAGIPIGFFPREQQVCACGDQIKQLITECLCGDIPTSVWQQRQNAASDASHPIHALTLLWDDPNRMPPTVNLFSHDM